MPKGLPWIIRAGQQRGRFTTVSPRTDELAAPSRAVVRPPSFEDALCRYLAHHGARGPLYARGLAAQCAQVWVRGASTGVRHGAQCGLACGTPGMSLSTRAPQGTGTDMASTGHPSDAVVVAGFSISARRCQRHSNARQRLGVDVLLSCRDERTKSRRDVVVPPHQIGPLARICAHVEQHRPPGIVDAASSPRSGPPAADG